MSPAPLEGLRVLDLTRLLPGPLATWMMAEQGAEVIKVEDPRGGDPIRLTPPLNKEGVGSLHAFLNRSKRSLALDLKKPEGRDFFLRLCASADLVVEGFRPGVMERLGLDYGELSARRPGLILCSISGFGQTGPWRLRPGHDLNFQALAGLLSQQGPAEQAPALPSVPVADLVGGCWQGLAAIFGALYLREKTGRGQHLDVSMCDGALSSLVLPLAELAAGLPVSPRGRGPLTGGLPAYGVFACADGLYLAVAAIEPHFFDALCQALDLEQFLGQAMAQGEQALGIRQAIADRLRQAPRRHWLDRLDELETCTEAVWSTEELPRSPQFESRGLFRQGPLGPELTGPLRLGPDSADPRPAPALGADSRALAEELGLDERRVQELVERKIIQPARERENP